MAKIGKVKAANKANAAKKADNKKKANKKNETAFDGVKKANNAKKANKAELQKQQAAKEANQKAAKKAAKERAAQLSAKNNNVKVKTKGNRVVKTFPNGKKVVETVNKNGKVVSKEVKTGQGNNRQVTTTNFDKNGNKISRITTQGKGENKTTKTINYEDNKKAEVTVQSKINGQNSSVTKEFDENGNIIKKTSKKGAGANIQTATVSYTYGANGRLKSQTKTESDGTVKTTEYSNYKTKENGKTTRKATVTITDAEGRRRQYSENQTLNKNDKITSAKRYNEDGDLIRTQRKKYDENGALEKNRIARFYEDGSKRVTVYSNFEQKNLKATTYDVKVETTSANGDVKTYEGNGKQFFDGSKTKAEDNLKQTFASGLVSKIKDFTTDLVYGIKEKFNGLDNAEAEELEQLEKVEKKNRKKENTNEIAGKTVEMETEIQHELIQEQEIQSSIQEMGEFFVNSINAQIKNPENIISASLDGFTQSEIGEIKEYISQKIPTARLVNNNGSYNVVVGDIESWLG